MTGNEHHFTRQHAQGDAFSFLKQMVELRAILFETRLQVENALEHLLNCGDVAANAYLAAKMGLQVWRSRKVISMCVSLRIHRTWS